MYRTIMQMYARDDAQENSNKKTYDLGEPARVQYYVFTAAAVEHTERPAATTIYAAV